MSDELIDIFDENNEPTGLPEMKSKAHKEGLWHRASHVWIYNSKGEILLQLRTKNKKLFPDKWDVSVGGHISAGEEPLTTAVRETKEELGLEITGNNLEFVATYQKEMIDGEIDNKEFYYVYLLKYDDSVDNLELQADEVSEVKFMSIAKLDEELKNNPEKFTPHGDYWFFIIEKIKIIKKGKNQELRSMLEVSAISTEKLRRGDFSKELPELFELKNFIENNSWHNNDSVFNHTLTVLEELEKLLKDVSDKINLYLDQKVDNHIRKELLFLGTLFHDIAKSNTLVKNGGLTSCPNHEEAGSEKVKIILNRFDLSG